MPPVTSVEAALDQRLGERLGVRRRSACAYVLNAGGDASCSATAMPAVVWLCGPPCRPGNTARSIALACCCLAHDHAAARAAQRLVRRRRDDVGDADRRRVRAAGDEPGDVRDVGGEDRADLVGDLARTPRSRSCAGSPCRRTRSASASPSARARGPRRCRCGWSSLRTPYCDALKYLPVIDTFQPCVRWPPAGRPRPMTVSPGLQEREVDGEVRRASPSTAARWRARRRTAPSRGRSPSSST